MAQGIFIDGRRPKSKKEIKEAVAQPSRVQIEATSLIPGTEFDGYADDMPEGKTIYFVGPDPYTSRKFYGQIVRKGGKITVK